MYYVSRFVGVAALVVLLTAAWWSIVRARADAAFRKRAPEDVARAVALAPGNADYLALQALQIEYAGGDASALLERMADLNPLSSAPRIRLGLAAEVRGEYAAAEKWLLEAARVDHQFEPRWTLTNFYFRRGRREEFWQWMRPALEVSYGDRRPAFDLCWRVSDEASEILTRAIPQRREVIASYLAYLVQASRLAAAGNVAMKLAAWHDPNDLAVLYTVCDNLIDAERIEEADALWIALGQRAPSGVTNSDFEGSRIGHGFDWRLAGPPGVTYMAQDTPPGLRIHLSGHQPEACELLRQIIGGLRSGERYSLRWEASTQNLTSPNGLEWLVANRAAPLEASQGVFTATSTTAVLVLVYRRPPGEARAQGFVDLRHVTVDRLVP
jgi:tetratricopeptide (TPR) repeat protein